MFVFTVDWATPDVDIEPLVAVPKELEEISTRLVAAGKDPTITETYIQMRLAREGGIYHSLSHSILYSSLLSCLQDV